MKFFKDSTGHSWELSINILQRDRINATFGVDILSLHADGKSFETFFDAAIAVDVIVLLMEKAIKAANISEADFRERLDGASFDAAYNAMLEELEDFFLSVRKSHLATSVRKLKENLVAGFARAAERVETELNTGKMLATLDAAMDAGLKETAATTSSSGNSPASSA